MPLPYDAILCDLDGVLRLWNTPTMADLDRAHGVPEGTLAATAFAPTRLLPAIQGTHTDEQWRASVTEALLPAYPNAPALVAAWTAMTGEVDEEVAALLAAARREVPVVLVTNATTRLESDLAALGILDLVDHVISSARVGVAKPDPRIYHEAAIKAGAQPTHCLFIDDSEPNVTAARALGMTAIHHRTPADLRKALTAG